MKLILTVISLAVSGSVLVPFSAPAQEPYQKDVIVTAAGNLEITFVGHGSLVFAWGGKVIHVDPYGKLADYAKLPKADLILLTHHHGDHLDPAALQAVRTDATELVLTETCARTVAGGNVLKNGEERALAGVGIKAVPAYNIVHKRDNGEPFHPRGEGNGYVLTLGDTRVYVAGDTENIPEMAALKGINVAFLPMNLPYTMTPEMVAAAARSIAPKLLYPYHTGETDTARVVELLKGTPGIEIRIRKMK